MLREVINAAVEIGFPSTIDYALISAGWKVTYDDIEHLKIPLKDEKLILIPISPNSFFQDLKKVLEMYINDINDPRKKTDLLENFKKGFLRITVRGS